MTTMVRSAVAAAGVAAVTVYVAEEVTAVGVPEMAPVEESRERPAGSDGETPVPLLVVGVTVVMAVPLVRVNVFGLHVKVGATSLTTIRGRRCRCHRCWWRIRKSLNW